ncbi:MAG: hypothetical protein ABI868_25590 [Acidobacteriota bacterium]
MIPTLRPRRGSSLVRPIAAAAAAALLLGAARPLPAATPQDFGFGQLTINGQPARGTFPLLVVIYELSTANSTRTVLAPGIAAAMDRLIFNTFALPSVSGYFLENSAAAFAWQRAAVLGPVTFDQTETAALYAQQSDDDGDGSKESGLDAAAGFSFLLGVIARKTGYDFAQWDANQDGLITQDELSVIVIGNNSPNGTSRAGANRPIGGAGLTWAVPGQNVTLRGQIASLDHHASFMTIAHELSHSLGTTDVYGPNCFSGGLTLMTCSIFPVDDDRRSYHLDPWHKMRFGWLAPRIVTLGSGGVATIAAAQINSGNTTMLLYDPARGTREFFIVEFRSNRVSAGFDHDGNVGGATGNAVSGMAVWHVDLNLNNSLTYHEGSPARQLGGQALWNGMTPPLTWTDGTILPTRFNPIAIVNGGRELMFEWITASDTFVDFAWRGTERGTPAEPFNSIGEAVNAASHGGTVKFQRAGTSAEAITVTKRLDLVATGGPVTLGR